MYVLITESLIYRKSSVASDYIHMNPERAGIVEKEEEFLNSFGMIFME
jgi:hypothetical protein